jgi:hypothetical protein
VGPRGAPPCGAGGHVAAWVWVGGRGLADFGPRGVAADRVGGSVRGGCRERGRVGSGSEALWGLTLPREWAPCSACGAWRVRYARFRAHFTRQGAYRRGKVTPLRAANPPRTRQGHAHPACQEPPPPEHRRSRPDSKPPHAANPQVARQRRAAPRVQGPATRQVDSTRPGRNHPRATFALSGPMPTHRARRADRAASRSGGGPAAPAVRPRSGSARPSPPATVSGDHGDRCPPRPARSAPRGRPWGARRRPWSRPSRCVGPRRPPRRLRRVAG